VAPLLKSSAGSQILSFVPFWPVVTNTISYFPAPLLITSGDNAFHQQRHRLTSRASGRQKAAPFPQTLKVIKEE